MIEQLPRQNIQVVASARLHMGFFDLNGASNRRFGSLGVSLSAPETKLTFMRGLGLFDGSLPKYIDKTKCAILQHINCNDDVSIRLDAQIPRHAGLGSGTQMALSVGAGISQLFGVNLTPAAIAVATGRGLRSGIGIGAFATGGVLLDGGRGKNTAIPPVMARYDFPKDWRILLIFDCADVGAHGQVEQAAFKQLKKPSIEDTQKVCYAVLTQALPALIEQDLTQFGKAIAIMQAYTGNYFSSIQNGQYSSKNVTKVLKFLIDKGVNCVGQSSWGPTGFAVFENQVAAEQCLVTLKNNFQQAELDWLICAANNQGALIL